MRVTSRRFFITALAIGTLAFQFAITNAVFADPAADQAYAYRCQDAYAACKIKSSDCQVYRDQFNAEGSVCPDVNAASNERIRSPKGAVAEQTPAEPPRCMAVRHLCEDGDAGCGEYKRHLAEDGIACSRISVPLTAPIQARLQAPEGAAAALGQADGLAEIQAGCDAARGYKTFGSQVKCIKGGIQTSRSLANADSGDVQLYLLTADKLVDDVARKQLTVAAARVELQRAYLDFRERTNRSIAEAGEQANAERFQAQRQQAEVERRQAAADAESRAAEAARQYAQAQVQEQANAQMMAAVQNCVALAYDRQNALATSPSPMVRINAAGLQGMRGMAGVTVENACQRDPNWYRTIPVAPPVQQQQRSHCDRDGMGGYDCASE
jgi:hypothetical protein